MRFAQIREIDISNGLGIGVSIFFQGCHFHCIDCFNKETWDFNGGQEYTEETTKTLLDLLGRKGITRFSILGGEPLEEINLFCLSKLINIVRRTYPHIKIWLYTGYTYENLLERIKESNTRYLDYILFNLDVLVDGQFVQEKKDIGYKYAGSTNQRVIDMNKSFKNNIVRLEI